MNAPAKSADPRKGLIAKVHVAKNQLRLDDDAYREILLRVTGKASSADCSIGALEELLREFVRLGWQARKTPPARAGKRPMADSEAALKLRALWISGYELGVVQDPREESLVAFCKRVSGGRKKGVDALQWLTETDVRKCIEALKSWLAREVGVDWSGNSPRLAVVAAQLGILIRAQLLDFRLTDVMDEMFGHCLVSRLDDRELDTLIRHIGEKVRAVKDERAR